MIDKKINDYNELFPLWYFNSYKFLKETYEYVKTQKACLKNLNHSTKSNLIYKENIEICVKFFRNLKSMDDKTTFKLNK